MADAFSDSTSPTMPFFTIAPENFRRVMQKQIQAHVAKEVDGITSFSNGFSKGNADGRFSNSLPSQTIQMSNGHGFQYFVVGSTRVGTLAVAAP